MTFQCSAIRPQSECSDRIAPHLNDALSQNEFSYSVGHTFSKLGHRIDLLKNAFGSEIAVASGTDDVSRLMIDRDREVNFILLPILTEETPAEADRFVQENPDIFNRSRNLYFPLQTRIDPNMTLIQDRLDDRYGSLKSNWELAAPVVQSLSRTIRLRTHPTTFTDMWHRDSGIFPWVGILRLSHIPTLITPRTNSDAVPGTSAYFALKDKNLVFSAPWQCILFLRTGVNGGVHRMGDFRPQDHRGFRVLFGVHQRTR
jgi:hypothetical protein